MSKNTGIKGLTVPQLSRAQRAEGRKADRSPEQQLAELDRRGAQAHRERARLNVALRGNQGAKT